MRVNESCANCLYGKQEAISKDPGFLAEVRDIIDGRRDSDTAPYLVYLFGKAYEKHIGQRSPFAEKKKAFNDLVLQAENEIRRKIASSGDPVRTALLFSRIGNYIDFGALKEVDENAFLALLDNAAAGAGQTDAGRNSAAQLTEEGIRSFKEACAEGRHFLLIADNCGEIVLDKLLLEELKNTYPQLAFTVLVRGGEVLNDVTAEDAAYAGIDRFAKVVSNGLAIAGTVYPLLSDEAKAALDGADVILAKGQGNYESLSHQGRHIYYSFLCKCDLFTGRFQVPPLTGLFIEEHDAAGKCLPEF